MRLQFKVANSSFLMNYDMVGNLRYKSTFGHFIRNFFAAKISLGDLCRRVRRL